MTVQLGKIIIKGEIESLTGLMIGGTNNTMQIGGLDKSIVRNPVTKRPYIPGSSLKGKLRSLLDLCDGTIEIETATDQNGRTFHKYKTTQDPTHKSARLFGTARIDDKQRPSNVIVRDGELKHFVQRRGSEIEIIEPEKIDSDSLYTEFKAENFIDRITAKATPRTFERVPRGGVFNLEMIVNFYQESDKQLFLGNLFQALQLLQDDYLGGSGSRGNGQVKIRIQSVTERSSAFYQDKEVEKNISLDDAGVPKDLR